MKRATALDRINKSLLELIILRDEEVERLFIDLLHEIKDKIGSLCLEHPDRYVAEKMRIDYQDLSSIIEKLTSADDYGVKPIDILEETIGWRTLTRDPFLQRRSHDGYSNSKSSQ